MVARAKKKPIAYELIPPDTEIGRPMYERLYRLLDTHHDELSKASARVAIAWAKNWKADADGRVTLGKCKRASDLDRELAPYDFVILLNRFFWVDQRVTDVQRDALMDHELCHAAVAYEQNGEPKRDERGRSVFRMRRHDLEEFADIAARYGCWKGDIESFAQALERADKVIASGGWVGFTRVVDVLREVGVQVTAHDAATWSDAERREVYAWGILRREAGAVANVEAGTVPACLAAVLVRGAASGAPA